MNRYRLILLQLCAVLSVAGHAATKVTDQQQYTGAAIPRPDTIWVYDLAATPADIPAGSALAGVDVSHNPPQTPEQIETGRQAGAAVAAELITQINAMGMKAQKGDATTKPQPGDLVIYGYLLSVVQGDKKDRVAVGLGKGDAELKVAVEGFRMTSQGLQKLGSGDSDATGSKMPGVGVGAVGTLVTHNPLGLIVSAASKEHREKTGEAGLGGREKDTATTIANELKKRFQEQGWVK